LYIYSDDFHKPRPSNLIIIIMIIIITIYNWRCNTAMPPQSVLQRTNGVVCPAEQIGLESSLKGVD